MSTTQGSVESLLKEDAPEIGLPLPSIVTLQRGVYDPVSNEWHTEAEVRELTGADEEYLASLETKATVTYADYMTALLSRAVVRIGNNLLTPANSKEVVENLIIGDRDLLFLGIVKCTYGREREYIARCGSCNEKNDVVVDLDEDFPLQVPEHDLHAPVEVTLRKGNLIRLRMPTGADSCYVGKHSSSTATQNTIMLSRCALLSDADRAGATPEEWAKNLSLADRGKLIKALLEVKAGPKMEGVNVQCAHCGEDMPINLNWMSLLFG